MMCIDISGSGRTLSLRAQSNHPEGEAITTVVVVDALVHITITEV